MKLLPRSRQSRFLFGAAVFLLTMTGALAILAAGGGATHVYIPVTPASGLRADEREYVEFVTPRLQELVVETSAVTVLVQNRSRNVLALNSHGTRITQLATDIRNFGDLHGVPARFAAVDHDIRGGLTLVTGTIAQARDALFRFQFDPIPNLIPQFAAGRDKLVRAFDELAMSSTPASNS